LSAVTAAVVGVVMNLAVWFGLHIIFPTPIAVDWFAVVVSVIAFIGMTRWRWDVIRVILGAGVAGLIFKMLIQNFAGS
jgi:chromate transporter